MAGVERNGRWPQAPARYMACFLPKGGTPDPGKKRPKVLRSVGRPSSQLHMPWAVVAPPRPTTRRRCSGVTRALSMVSAPTALPSTAHIVPLVMLREVAHCAAAVSRPMLDAHAFPNKHA